MSNPNLTVRLEQEFASLEDQERRIIKRKRVVAEEINEIRRAARPEFPTEAQVAGLKAAVEIIRNGVTHGDHLGSAAIEGDYSVVTSGAPRGWISVRDDAPYGFRGYGQGKLWSFTDQEIGKFKRVLMDEGFRVVDSWRHADGVSLIVAAI